MTDANDDSFRSITGVAQSAEPASSAAHRPTAASSSEPSASKATPPASASDSGPASMRQALNGGRSLNVSGSPSTANSPLSSRDTSPARPPLRTTGPSGSQAKPGLRSKKSSTDVSPNRGPGLAGSSTTVPSAAAIQRALSSANIPQLQPAPSQEPSRVPRPSKSTPAPSSGDTTPHWPVSPRLKSPPPAPDARSRSRRNSLRNHHKKPESASTPSIVVQSSSAGLRCPWRTKPSSCHSWIQIIRRRAK
ncbi:hypothetical protein BU26DRAFT_86783 [Trematosphaeria pertusa]|uniref:Uncharacterized protein n=1 Tax=Trematosphaeria pertusa TaxID=390896 RepID=A0A6A6I2U2_9PLEO|nr:uncharacterized protein BU26DRAFT_86783 [Trematosphaeria pertusa]KAF2244794.1 hypothetical protein BU26DRAFT_86783 [Trematosphaeria pertusa]